MNYFLEDDGGIMYKADSRAGSYKYDVCSQYTGLLLKNQVLPTGLPYTNEIGHWKRSSFGDFDLVTFAFSGMRTTKLGTWLPIVGALELEYDSGTGLLSGFGREIKQLLKHTDFDIIEEMSCLSFSLIGIDKRLKKYLRTEFKLKEKAEMAGEEEKRLLHKNNLNKTIALFQEEKGLLGLDVLSHKYIRMLGREQMIKAANKYRDRIVTKISVDEICFEKEVPEIVGTGKAGEFRKE